MKSLGDRGGEKVRRGVKKESRGRNYLTAKGKRRSPKITFGSRGIEGEGSRWERHKGKGAGTKNRGRLRRDDGQKDQFPYLKNSGES